VGGGEIVSACVSKLERGDQQSDRDAENDTFEKTGEKGVHWLGSYYIF